MACSDVACIVISLTNYPMADGQSCRQEHNHVHVMEGSEVMRVIPEAHGTPRNRASRGAFSQVRLWSILGAVISGVGYCTTFVVDIVRSTPSDDSIVFGVEVACAATAVLCALVVMMTWLLTKHSNYLASVWTLTERARKQIEHEAAVEAAGGYGNNTIPISSARGRRGA